MAHSRAARHRPGGALAALALAALAGTLCGAAVPSVGLGAGASRASLRIDSSGDALISWRQAGKPETVLVPPSGPLSHGGALRGPDVSRPASSSGLPFAVAVRRTPDVRLWALQELQIGAQARVELDLSRWRGAPTALTLSSDGVRLAGTLSFHGAPLSGYSLSLAGKRPRIYVQLDCFGCPGKPGWSPLLGVPPRRDGGFAVLLRAGWRSSRYRATVVGPNIGTTLSPDAQTILAVG
jgi:hypothetical protein